MAGYNYTAGDVVSGHGVWYMALIKALGASDVNVTSRLTVFDDPYSRESKLGPQNLVFHFNQHQMVWISLRYNLHTLRIIFHDSVWQQ